VALFHALRVLEGEINVGTPVKRWEFLRRTKMEAQQRNYQFWALVQSWASQKCPARAEPSPNIPQANSIEIILTFKFMQRS